MTAPLPSARASAPGSVPPATGASVVVVGAGPVGQTAALLLARYGVPVVLLDARPARETVGSRATCQQRDVLDVWDWCGAGRIAEEGLTWTRSRVFYRDRELLTTELDDSGASSLPPFVNLAQSRTEEILDDLIDASPLIDMRWGHEVHNLEQGPDGVRLTARTVRGPQTVHGRYVVACVGARGATVRSLLGVDFPGRTFDDAFLVCDVRADVPAVTHERQVHFDPSWHRGRQAVVLPCPQGMYRLDWQVDHDLDLSGVEGQAVLAGMVRRQLGQTAEVRWASVYRFHARLASRFRVGDVFLAGDAAHLLPPFGARGLNSGVADVDNLAWKLAAVLHGWAPDALLDSYALERRAAAEENLAVTTATMDFLVPRTPAQEAERHRLLEQSMHSPEARAHVDGGRLAEPFCYGDSPLTTPGAERSWTGRPARGRSPGAVAGSILPDAVVERAPGAPDADRPTRLRGLVRGGITVLTDGRLPWGAALGALRSALPAGAPAGELDLTSVEGAEPVRRALDWEPGDLWLVRPDAHTAARVRTLEDLATAARRLAGTVAPTDVGRRPQVRRLGS